VDYFSLESLPGGLQSSAFPMDGRSPDPQEVAEERELHSLVFSAVQELTPGTREAVLLFYFKHLSVQEVATVAGISVEAVKVRLHRGRQQLRQQLLKQYPDIDWVVSPEQRRQTMIPVKIADVVSREDRYIVILFDEAGQRILPIWIGPFEAQSIAMGVRNLTMERPMTYQFMGSLLAALGAKLEEARVEALKGDTFYGVAKIQLGDHAKEIDARPSDVLALAAHSGSPIFVGEEVMANAGVDVGEKAGRNFQSGRGMDLLWQEWQERWKQVRQQAPRDEEEVRKSVQDLVDFLYGGQGE
jgi:bifunctional DNase/RNase